MAAEIVDMNLFSLERAVDRTRKAWAERFPEELTIETRLIDLSDRTLLELSRPGMEVMSLIHGLVMAVFGLGRPAKFDYLEPAKKLEVLDAALFLGDQIRWECLRRLGWVEAFPGREYPLVELVRDFKKIKAEFEPRFPRPLPDHPKYAEYERRLPYDGEAVLRSMIPAGLAEFSRRCENQD